MGFGNLMYQTTLTNTSDRLSFYILHSHITLLYFENEMHSNRLVTYATITYKPLLPTTAKFQDSL